MAVLSWASVLLVSALAVVGCVEPYPYQAAPYAQPYGGYGGTYYAPPPQNPYATPWVGSNTPWVYYNGDWFLNGMLYNYYGNQYGWAPYYAYPSTYIVRPNNWYEPKWNTWYQQHPQYWQDFTKRYPYWREHHSGQRYDQNFYNRYHRSQGEGWQRGFHGRSFERPQPEGPGHGPAQVTPRQGPRPVPGQVTPHEGPRPGPGQVTPREIPRPGSPGQITPREGSRPGPGYMTPQGTRPGPGQMAPREAPRAAPSRVTPREAPRSTPGQVTPREGPRPGPARVTPSEGARPAPSRATPHEAPRSGPGHTTPHEGSRSGPASNQPELR